MKAILLLLITLLLITSCDTKSNLHYMTATSKINDIRHTDLKVMQQEISRYRDAYYRSYYIAITPLTKPFLVAKAKNDAYKENWTKERLQSDLRNILHANSNNKEQEFLINILSQYSDSQNTNYLSGYVEDSVGRKYSLTFNQDSKTQYTTLDNLGRDDDSYQFYKLLYGRPINIPKIYDTTTQASINSFIDLTQPFKIILEARYRNQPSVLKFEWGGTKDGKIVAESAKNRLKDRQCKEHKSYCDGIKY